MVGVGAVRGGDVGSPRLPGVYMAREGEIGDVVYIGARSAGATELLPSELQPFAVGMFGGGSRNE